MTLETKLEQTRDLAVCLTEANGTRSREVATVQGGSGKLEPGTVLGQITANGKYKPATSGGTDGAQNAAAVLAYAVDASAAETDVTDAVLIARDAEVKDSMLTFDSSVDTAAKRSTKIGQLASATIFAR